ncbi:MAG: hypothetical protein IJT97_08040 [Bacteroidaceae bacterium]|nr:hypothetical protein [Bacteroidaceae bacterium]
MKRKDYEKPTMQVVKLQHHGMLMTSVSNQDSRAGVQNYNMQDEQEW